MAAMDVGRLSSPRRRHMGRVRRRLRVRCGREVPSAIMEHVGESERARDGLSGSFIGLMTITMARSIVTRRGVQAGRGCGITVSEGITTMVSSVDGRTIARNDHAGDLLRMNYFERAEDSMKSSACFFCWMAAGSAASISYLRWRSCRTVRLRVTSEARVGLSPNRVVFGGGRS